MVKWIKNIITKFWIQQCDSFYFFIMSGISILLIIIYQSKAFLMKKKEFSVKRAEINTRKLVPFVGLLLSQIACLDLNNLYLLITLFCTL